MGYGVFSSGVQNLRSLHKKLYVIKKFWYSTNRVNYNGGQLRWDGNNVSFCVPPTIDIMKTNKGPLKSPIKMLQEMQKKKNNFFNNCWLLGPFSKKPCFWKMGMAGIKWWPCLSTRPSFSVNINEEAFLKVSFKNIDWFQIWKNYFFQKGPKNKQILKNLNFFCISICIFNGLFNGILFVFILPMVFPTL